MKYTYAYKSSDGVRHEDAMEAGSRDEVFAALRKRGIRPIKVVAADGAKANGEIRGVRKRVVALVALVLVICAVIVGILSFHAGETHSNLPNSNIQTFPQFPQLTDQTRRQVIGDPAVIEKGIRTGWSDVFAAEGDRFLASFAIPGVKAGVGTVNAQALDECLKDDDGKKEGGESRSRGAKEKAGGESSSRGAKAADSKIALSLEGRQIIAMVEGMKREARAYLAAGGTLSAYGRRLTERQDAEIAIRHRVETEIRSAQKTLSEEAFAHFCDQRNDELRNLGILPVTRLE